HGHPARPGWCAADPLRHREHAQHHVAHGSHHDDRHCGVEQHPDRRVHGHAAQAGTAAARSGCRSLQGSAASHPDDLTRYAARHDAPGARDRGRKPAVRPAGPRHHRRTGRVRDCHGFPRAGRLSHHSWPRRARSRGAGASHMTRLLETILLATLAVPAAAVAQNALATLTLPSAPVPGLVSQAADIAQAQPLTRAEAERLAILHNPRISVGRLLALAQHQVVREARSAYLPSVVGSITAEQAEDGSRVSAGSLTAPRLFTHAGAGGSVSQLITDFGRTRNLVASQKLEEKAQNTNALAVTEDIVLATDQAFYNVLQAQALLKVAAQTVETRQTTETLVNQMTQNKLKSTLDLSFAEVDLSQARLLQLDARNNANATMASLDAILGLDHAVR